MHGNTIKSPNGYKPDRSIVFWASSNHSSRYIKPKADIWRRASGNDRAGRHRCIGARRLISEVNLKDRYQTHCDQDECESKFGTGVPNFGRAEEAELIIQLRQQLFLALARLL